MANFRYALTYNPTIYDSLVKQFWQTVTVRTLANEIQELVASINNKEYTITEAFVRSKLQLADATGISNLPIAEIYEGLATLGFLQMILGITTENNGKYLAPTLTKKLFANMKRGYAGDYVPLLPAMLAGATEDQGEGSTIPAEPQHTPTDPVSSTSQLTIPSTNEPLPQPSPPRQLDRQDTEIPQSQGPTFTHVADKATTTVVMYTRLNSGCYVVSSASTLVNTGRRVSIVSTGMSTLDSLTVSGRADDDEEMAPKVEQSEGKKDKKKPIISFCIE
ncbi:hypothetical protein Tco_1349268, partial [Tanacetum coccineum]